MSAVWILVLYQIGCKTINCNLIDGLHLASTQARLNLAQTKTIDLVQHFGQLQSRKSPPVLFRQTSVVFGSIGQGDQFSKKKEFELLTKSALLTIFFLIKKFP